MHDTKAAHRYALAFIDVAGEMKNLDTVNRDIEFLDAMLRDVHEFGLFLKNPIINTAKKKRVITDLLQGKIGEITQKFLLLLLNKNREALLPDIVQEFYRLRDERMGVLNVLVRTAVLFTSAQQDQLVRQLAAATKKKVKMNYVVDSSLRGGFTVQYVDTVWDASVQHQLELLRKRFAEGAV